jgi:hypothetical protein
MYGDSGMYKGYSKSNLLCAVNKTTIEKKFIIYKNTYILKLLLRIVTTGNEALVI